LCFAILQDEKRAEAKSLPENMIFLWEIREEHYVETRKAREEVEKLEWQPFSHIVCASRVRNTHFLHNFLGAKMDREVAVHYGFLNKKRERESSREEGIMRKNLINVYQSDAICRVSQRTFFLSLSLSFFAVIRRRGG
jgi:HD-GYP domain-containing protein (c-di-GMP phosphodiesterase class II)